MGFLEQTTNVTLTAKLTPFGRQQLLLNTSSMITQFSIGDSDANYTGDLSLDNIPSISGEIGANNTFNNGLYSGTKIKTPIIVNSTGATKKPVQAGSNAVVITPVINGLKTISADTMTQLIVNRTLGDTNGNANLFHSFGLPITQADKDKYTTYTVANGGYLDSAIRNINQSKVLVIAISECEYGEVLDGKAIKINLKTTGGTEYNIYSTFQKSLTSLTAMDSKIVENQSMGVPYGNNVALLFSDLVRKPNGNAAKSWGTGFGTTKPFSLNAKEQFNATTVGTTIMDHAIGIAYLSKGIIVITHPDIVNNYDVSGTETTIKFNHISNEIAQNVTCIIERDEFANSTNITRTDGEPIRVSEVALYDASNNMIAMAKSNKQVLIGANQFMALGVRILV
mgnify:CR=1 FL=1|jgi:hypothetical protein